MRSESALDAPLTAFVMMRDVVSVGLPEIARVVSARFGADARILTPPSEGDGPTGLLIVDGIGILVIPVPEPIPAGDDLRALARSAHDPDGSLAEHAEHVIVQPSEPHTGREESLDAALAVLKVCYALCETARASAVLWYLSRVLLDRETFMAMLSPERLAQMPLPITVLVKFEPFRMEKGDGARLAGMSGFGFRRYIGRDIEFAPSTAPLQEQFARFIDLGLALLGRGLYIQDGESFGWSADDVFRARYLEKGQAIEGPVVSFVAEKLDSRM